MALVNMASQFQGLPMGDLIGGPLNAACDAQVRLALATANFIKVVGFQGPADGATNGDDFGPVRTAKFKFARPVQIAPAVPAGPDGTGAVAAKIGSEDVELEVPLLAIVKIPALSITTVDITFDMEVKSSESSKDSTDASASVTASGSIGWGPYKASVSVTGSVATHKENTRSSDNSAKYHVEVHAADSGMPEGLSRVLDILATSIAPKTVGAVTAPA